MSSQHSRSAQVLSVIDSDYDEDDEYQHCEMDEIFSISPNGDELCDFDPNKEGSDFELDDEMTIVPGGGPGGIHDMMDDEDEEDDGSLSETI